MDWRQVKMTDSIKIYDHATGVELVRDMTEAEQKIRDKEVSDALAIKAEKQAEKKQAEADKAALLAKLGITADEFKTLLG